MAANTGSGRADRGLQVSGKVIRWIWEKLTALLFVAVLVLIVLASFTWKDSAAVSTMQGELEQRAFTEITVVHEPTMTQTKVFSLFNKGNSGTYSAKAGNCRFVIETPGNNPTVTVVSQNDDIEDVVIADVDMTRLSQSPATSWCF